MLYADVRVKACLNALIHSNDVSAGKDMIPIIDTSLIADILAPEKALVPLMHSSWKQVLEELEAIDKLKEHEET